LRIRDGAHKPRATVGRRLQLSGPAEPPRAVAYALQAKPFAKLPVGGQPPAVIRDTKGELSVLGGQDEFHRVCFTVPSGIADGFLRDAVEVGRCDAVLHPHRALAVERACHAKAVSGLAGQGIEGAHEALFLYRHRAQAARQRPDLVAEGRDNVLGFPHVIRFGEFLGTEPSVERREGKEQAGELLAHGIMQVLADAPALRVADAENLLLQPSVLGDIEPDANHAHGPARRIA
jgi:hypothetical protein